jgi:glycerophosphoryl diester phosphodiesterase
VRNLPLLLGHRGARSSAGIPENSVTAFELAMKHGCDGFEFDVRMTADGQAVVCHDPKSKGITLAKAKHAQCRHLASLEEVVSRFSKHAFLDIELKVPGLEEHLLSVLREHPPERGCVVSSFLPEVLIELRAGSETVSLGIICDRSLPPWKEMPINYLIPHRSLVTPGLVKSVHNSGKHLLTWMVNDRDSMVHFANWGVDGIISDKTELLVKTLGTDHGRGSGPPLAE